MAKMKTATFSTVVAYLAIVLICSEAQDDDTDYPINAPCYKLFAYWIKRIGKLVGACYNERRPKARYPGDPNHVFFLENINCTVRCVIIKMGLLKPDGNVDMDEVLYFAEKYLPEKLRDFVADVLNECIHYADDLTKEDENCSKFGKIIGCASRRVPVLTKLCYSDYKMIPIRPYPSKSGNFG